MYKRHGEVCSRVSGSGVRPHHVRAVRHQSRAARQYVPVARHHARSASIRATAAQLHVREPGADCTARNLVRAAAWHQLRGAPHHWHVRATVKLHVCNTGERRPRPTRDGGPFMNSEEAGVANHNIVAFAPGAPSRWTAT